jgi:hypothetical protein
MANHYHKRPALAIYAPTRALTIYAPTRALTIYEALCVKFGREPTNTELKAEVARIIAEGNALGRARL